MSDGINFASFYLNPATLRPEQQGGLAGSAAVLLYVWSPTLLMPVMLTADASGNLAVSGGGGGGGGGAVTVADGADIAQGALADAAVVTDANGSISGKLRGLVKMFASVWDSGNGRFKVDGSAVTQPVSGTVTANQGGTWTVGISASQTMAVTNAGTFAVQAAQSGTWNITNISGTISLPTGASTSALQSTINTTLGSPFQAGGSIANTAFGISGTLPAFASTPTFNLGTLNGASTAALQTTGNTSLANLDVLLSTRLKPADTLAGVTLIDTLTGITNPVAVTAAALPLPANAAQEAGGNLAALVTQLTALLVAQGASAPTASGPLVQGYVSDSPNNYLDNEVRPLSLNSDGRLRVATTPAATNLDFFGDDFNFSQAPDPTRGLHNILMGTP
ncbi:MAG: hypothetical protein ABIO88_10560 [Burkholderiaceae bacterium]